MTGGDLQLWQRLALLAWPAPPEPWPVTGSPRRSRAGSRWRRFPGERWPSTRWDVFCLAWYGRWPRSGC